VGVPSIGRWIGCRAGGPWFIVDWADGRGEHDLTNWLHLHPDVEVEECRADEVRLRLGTEIVRLGTLSPGRLQVIEGMYCPEFGRRVSAPVVRWKATCRLPTACGWWLRFGNDPGRAVLRPDPAGYAALVWNGVEVANGDWGLGSSPSDDKF
jgi:hypothetical protein